MLFHELFCEFGRVEIKMESKSRIEPNETKNNQMGLEKITIILAALQTIKWNWNELILQNNIKLA